MSKIAALVVAAGKGLRAGGGVPKQYRPVGGAAILRHTVKALLEEARFDVLKVVIGEDDRELYDQALTGLDDARISEPCAGGATRAASVANGLAALRDLRPDHVFIHDGARPFVNAALLDPLFDALKNADGAFPGLEVVDALWETEDDRATNSLIRKPRVRAQTPQAFDFARICEAFETADPDAGDDVSVARAHGLDIAVTPGREENFKVTNPEDFARAERQMQAVPDIRVGNGYDVHRFCTGSEVILCGVAIPFDRALSGHSDADVGLHAITDAIFGALAKGDIGQWFPPSDPRWKGAPSDIFLKKAAEEARADGFEITNVDCTLVCEMPKIGPHSDAMRAVVADILGIGKDRVSVKATTSERLGFTGRGEGIAAQATATLVRT